MEGGAIIGTTALVYSIDSYISANIQEQYRVAGVQPAGAGRPPQGSPRALASAGRRRGQRSPTSVAVSVDRMGTVSVEPVMALPVLGMQKPPRQVGKQFKDRLLAASEGKVKKPAVKTRPTWLWRDRLGANPAVCCGDTGCQARCLQLCRP